MTARIKRYRVADGRTVIPPVGLFRAPHGGNARFVGGETFDVDSDHPEVSSATRFIRARVRAGDIIEVESRDMPTATADTSARPPRKDGDK